MYEGLLSTAADLIRPWVWPAAAVAVGSFLLFTVLGLWVWGPGFAMFKRAGAGESGAEAPGVARRLGGGVARAWVGLVGLVWRLVGKVSAAAAVVAVVGFLLVTFVSPTSAGAGNPLLAQAQQVLRNAIPAEYAKVANLGAPGVATKDGTTTFTFHIPKKSAGKAGKALTYTVKIGPGGVQVGQQ